MRYENKLEIVNGSWEFVTIVVPNVEVPFILLESINKSVSIFHHIFMLVAIDIHPILLFSIFPP
jgi:hypothetical protein